MLRTLIGNAVCLEENDFLLQGVFAVI